MQTNIKNVLDLCCGTGDLVVQLGRKVPAATRLTALDYSQPMLDLARKKAIGNRLSTIEFIHGDAVSMPFPDKSFDSIGIYS